MIKDNIRFAVLPLLAVLLTACSKDDTADDQPPQDVTRWECILFGSYPASEVVSGSFDAVDDYALAYLPCAPVEILLITFVPILFAAGAGLWLMLACLAASLLLLLLAKRLHWWNRT